MHCSRCVFYRQLNIHYQGYANKIWKRLQKDKSCWMPPKLKRTLPFSMFAWHGGPTRNPRANLRAILQCFCCFKCELHVCGRVSGSGVAARVCWTNRLLWPPEPSRVTASLQSWSSSARLLRWRACHGHESCWKECKQHLYETQCANASWESLFYLRIMYALKRHSRGTPKKALVSQASLGKGQSPGLGQHKHPTKHWLFTE